ncbi:MAG: hypothetical protein WC651_03825 [Candidatus Gracilibacteria bacterium]|jgi:hypothetical protein
MNPTQDPTKTGQRNEAIERAEEKRILDDIKKADGKSEEFSYSAKIAQKLERGEIDLDREQRMKLRDTLKDQNKMKKEVDGRLSYEHFMTALADGKFPNHGRRAMRFLEAIEEPDEKEKSLAGEEKKIFPGKKERKYARDLLEHLSRGGNPQLSERAEQSSLEMLDRLRKEERKETMEREKETSNRTSKTRTEVASTSAVKEELWEVDRPPEGLIANLEAIDLKMDALQEQSNATYAKGGSTKKTNAEIERLEFERVPLKKQWLDYLRKAGERYLAIQKLARQTGLDMKDVSGLLFLTDEKSGSTKSGQKSLRVKKTIELKKIYFTEQKDEEGPDFAGELVVEYVTQGGKTEKAGFTQFLEMVDTLGIHKDIKTQDKLNKELEENTGYEGVKEGQVYSAKVLVALKDDGEKVYEQREFKIVRIGVSDRQEPVIELDRNVTTRPGQWISNSADPSLYQDSVKKEFSFGEFAQFVKRHGYSRKIARGELQTVLDRMAKARRQEEIEMNETVAQKLTGRPPTETSKKRFESTFLSPLAANGAPIIPKTQGEETPVDFYDDESGGRRVLDAKLTLGKDPETGEDTFGISYPETVGNVANLTGLSGIPEEMQRAGGTPPPQEPRIVQRKFSQPSFMELANKGAVANGALAAGEQDEGLQALQGHPPAQKTKDAEEKDEHETKKQKYYEEAVSFEEAYKTGLPAHGQAQSYVRTVWNNTRFLSLSDLWKMGKTCYEYYERRFEQGQKNRYGVVGREFPFFGSEMQQNAQAANNEQTSHFKEALEKKGVLAIRERLRVSSNKEEFKACIIVLTEKGMMNWQDVAFWRNLNKFVKPGKEVPIPENGNPYTHISVTDTRTGYDFLEGAIDSCWGEGYYGEWYSGNKSHYDSHAKNFYAEGKELEGVDGAHARKLAQLLHHHKEGHFVDPMEYEGLILHMIDAGKVDMEDKIYFLVEGVAAKNDKGETILTLDRMAHVNGEHLAKFPLLEYMTAKAPRPPDGKETSRFTLEDFERWVGWFDGNDKHNYQPTQAVNDFMWEYAIPSDDTLNRINKVARSIEAVDHDDLFAYIPPATEDVLTDICKTNTGARKGATIEGYANVFPGFSQYMKSLSQHGYKDKLAEAIKSYVRFEGIMTNKFERQVDSGHDVYQRMGDKTLKSATICSKEPPLTFIGEMNGVVREIVNAYENSDLIEILDEIQNLQVGDMSDPDEKRKQDKKNYAYQRFGRIFSQVTAGDDQEKMLRIMQSSKLTGMGYTPAAEKTRLRAERRGEIQDSKQHA